MIKWAERADELRDLKATPMSFARMAKRLGVTRNAVIGAYTRHVLGRHREGGVRPRKTGFRRGMLWTEARLTETWAERKARRSCL